MFKLKKNVKSSTLKYKNEKGCTLKRSPQEHVKKIKHLHREVGFHEECDQLKQFHTTDSSVFKTLLNIWDGALCKNS